MIRQAGWNLVPPNTPLTSLPPRPLPGIHDLGTEYPVYAPFYRRPTYWIDAHHEAIANLPEDGALIRGSVQGFLRKADALTLYELAYLAPGDVLELGSAWGLSTSILAQAVRHSGRRARVASIEIAADFQQASRQTIQAAQLDPFYESLAGAAAQHLPALTAQGREFGMAFIDHDHSFEATREACTALTHLLPAGGIAVFHDFNDARNREEPAVYGVYRGVCEWTMHNPDFAFIGIAGCCGLVQRRTT